MAVALNIRVHYAYCNSLDPLKGCKVDNFSKTFTALLSDKKSNRNIILVDNAEILSDNKGTSECLNEYIVNITDIFDVIAYDTTVDSNTLGNTSSDLLLNAIIIYMMLVLLIRQLITSCSLFDVATTDSFTLLNQIHAQNNGLQSIDSTRARILACPSGACHEVITQLVKKSNALNALSGQSEKG